MRRAGFRGVSAVLVSLAALGSLAAPALPQDEPRAAVTAKGWWGKVPIAPPLGFAPPLANPGVPQGAVAVSATAGENDKVAALALALEVPEGSTLEGLSLQLKEATDPGATVLPDQAVIVACPITAPWEPAEGGDWEKRPQADCALAKVTGVRDPTSGVWSFDLMPMAERWLSRENPLPNQGVLLQGEVGATGTFQVSFSDPAKEGGLFVSGLPSVGVTETGGGAEEAPPPEQESPVPPPPPPAEGLPAAGGGVGSVQTLPASPGVGPSPSPRATARAIPAGRAGIGLWEGLNPWWALGIPLALALALAASYTLGPEAARAASWRRRGPVARALSVRRGQRTH